MNGKSSKISPAGRTARNARDPEPSGTGLPFVFAVGGAAILLGYLVIHSLGSAKSEPESAAPAPPVAASQPPVLAKKRRVMPPVVRASPFPDVVVVTTNPPALPQPDPMPAPTQPHAPGSAGVAQDLVARLSRSDLFAGGVTPQKVEELKGSFKQLAEQGGASVPAIREFLDRFQDIDFDAVGAGKQVGYPSLRIGLLNVLGQIGEPEAAELSLQTLQKTGDPLEIALLAKGLGKQLPPEQFREAALTAASEALAQAASGKWDGRSVTPLFEVLQKYGDQSVVNVLEQSAGKWNYYSTLALAGLPDGAGIPTLVRLAQDPAITGVGNGDFALRPLAQAAMQFPEARTALMDQAKLNQIPDRAWPAVATSLAGTYIQYGNQLFGSTAPPVVWSNDQINQRVALIDQMLGVTTSPAGAQALQNARAQVVAKLPRQ